MKRSLWLILACGLLCAAVQPVLAQEHESKAEAIAEHQAGAEHKEESFAEKHELELKIANFAILAGLLGYFIGKNAGPFFAARSAGIHKDMEESLRQSQEAEARAAAVEQRIANLEADIAALRAEGDREISAEGERVARQTAEEIAKIQVHAQQEIASAGKAARMELKRYTADLAVNLAETKVRAHMTPEAQDALVKGFVQTVQ
jgi:F-type H+-transporting ATPase subunit b